MTLTIHQVDSFASRPFEGNPAAVCPLPSPRPDAWMRHVAAEMNLSETAFLVPRADGSFDLRWFTPEVEVSLCGHATLAAAHVLWDMAALSRDSSARFHTKSGMLTCRMGEGGWIEMDFPAKPLVSAEQPPDLAIALRGAGTTFYGESETKFLAELESEEVVRELKPDLEAIKRLGKGKTGLIVTAKGKEGGDFDFVSRFFAPAAGINEDPVTGAAHCVLACHWRDRMGRKSFLARQVSARGGNVRLAMNGDRVLLCGQAVTVMRAQLLVN